MNLKELLEKRKSAITKKWFDMVVDTYPSDTSIFLKKQKDPFDNPVGNATLEGVNGMFDELLGNMDPEKINAFLDPIIRIRAVQSFSASKAVGFIFFLKAIIRESVKDDIQDQTDELLALELNIDELGLIAFDIYMTCRETLYRIKAEEEKKRTFSAFERAGLIKEI